VEATSIKFGTAHYLHPLSGKGKTRVKGAGGGPSNPTKIGEGRQPTPTSNTGHCNRHNLDLPTNSPGTTGVKSM